MSKALKGVPGVAEAEVQVGSATVTCDSSVDAGRLKAALADAGYDTISVSA